MRIGIEVREGLAKKATLWLRAAGRSQVWEIGRAGPRNGPLQAERRGIVKEQKFN